MTSPIDNGNRWAALGVAVFALGCMRMAADLVPAVALVNESPSVPRGLYLRRPGASPGRGALVAVPQPPAARPYLASLGMPAEVLLIKRVAAAGGDRVCRDGATVKFRGRRAIVRDRDGRGAALDGWNGCRRLAADELFLLGDSPASFDSRYFGPVRVSDVDGVFRETLTW